MRPLWTAALAVAVTLSSACADDASNALAPEGSAEAQVWFERALALDLGSGTARVPRAVPSPRD
jgi:hypothetical protein